MQHVRILAVLILSGLFGCTQGVHSISDQGVDPVEAAVIQVAVGAAMAALPDTIVPAYGVTSALLAERTNELAGAVNLEVFDDIVRKEINKLNLDPLTLQSCNELVVLVEAKISQQFSGLSVPDADRLVVVWQVIEIVNKTAEARLEMAPQKG